MSYNKDFTAKTIKHYQNNVTSFWAGTKTHDVSQNYEAFQQSLPLTQQKTKVLDFGCGPGRDLLYFTEQGYDAIGLDACTEFCKMARDYANCEVWKQDFCDLTLPNNTFHGVFANASLFHIPKPLLSDVLQKLSDCLTNQGVLFCSNPRGDGEYFDGSRYGNYMEYEEYESFLHEGGFAILQHYYRPFGKPRHEQPWLAIVAKKL